jgi:hypothetical protein
MFFDEIFTKLSMKYGNNYTIYEWFIVYFRWAINKEFHSIVNIGSKIKYLSVFQVIFNIVENFILIYNIIEYGIYK